MWTTIKQWLRGHRITLVGVFLGAVAGYLYWRWVGCVSGTCAITSNPWNSTLYFSLMGGLLFSSFVGKKV